MFDVGFSEMLVIAIVAAIVIGPERLPKVSRTLGHMAGRLRRYVRDVKADINREMELETLRTLKDQFLDSARSAGQTIHDEVSKMHSQAQQIDPHPDALPSKAHLLSAEIPTDSTTLVELGGGFLPQPETALWSSALPKTVT